MPGFTTPPRPHTFNFTTGKNRWGFALHAETWTVEAPRYTGRWRWRKRLPDRASVLVHCSPPPYPGDFVLFTSKSGRIRRAAICGVKCQPGVHDMYELTLEDADGHAAD